MKTASEKVWAEVFGVELSVENTAKSEKNTAPAIGNPGVLDDDDSNIEGVCVMDFSGFRDYVNENGTLLKVLNVLTSILLFAYFLYPLERITVSYWT